MKILTFHIMLRRMSVLTKMLMVVSRLGGKVTYLSAVDRRATLVIQAPLISAHRFAPQLRRMVDVLEIIELRTNGSGMNRKTDNEADARPELGVA